MSNDPDPGKQKSRAEVYIIESLGLSDEEGRREGEVISRTLRMSGKEPIYRYVRTKREFEYFLGDFARSGYRYLHLSCHGAVDRIALTLESYTNIEFAHASAAALHGRRLFLSACSAATSELATAVFSAGSCLSLAGPQKKIFFDDAAVFWSAFYHLMFKKDAGRMKQRDIAENMYIMAWALAEPFSLYTRQRGKDFKHYSLPSDRLLTERLEQMLELGEGST